MSKRRRVQHTVEEDRLSHVVIVTSKDGEKGAHGRFDVTGDESVPTDLVRESRPIQSISTPHDITIVKRCILRRIAIEISNPNEEGHALFLHSDNAISIQSAIESSVIRGENCAVVLVGPRGCGKSATLTRALAVLDKSLDSSPARKDCKPIVLRLNGFVHGDDSSALKAIVSQLLPQMQYKESSGATIADKSITEKALSSLGFIDNLQVLFTSLFVGAGRNDQEILICRPVVIILDEFDLFVSNAKKVLYNLLDSSQCPNVRLCLIGMSTRVDVVETLEKRVRSRFSYRLLSFYPLNDSLKHLELAKSILLIDDDSNSYIQRHNNAVNKLCSSPIFLKEVINKLTSARSDIRSTLNIIRFAIAQLSFGSNDIISLRMFTNAINNMFYDPIYLTIESLSNLEVVLLVAMKRLEDRRLSSYDFDTIYDEYKKFLSKSSVVNLSFSRDVVMKAFEQLLSTDLIRLESVSTNRGLIGGSLSIDIRRSHGLSSVQLVILPDSLPVILATMPHVMESIKRWAIELP